MKKNGGRPQRLTKKFLRQALDIVAKHQHGPDGSEPCLECGSESDEDCPHHCRIASVFRNAETVGLHYTYEEVLD